MKFQTFSSGYWPVFVAAGTAFVLYWPGSRQGLLVVLGGLACSMGAFLCAVGRNPVASRNGPRRFLAASCLLIGGIYGSLTEYRLLSNQAVFFTGLPPETVVRFAGITVGDSRSSPSGWQNYQVSLLQVQDAEQAKASAAGTITLMVRAGKPLATGSPVLVSLKSGLAERVFAEDRDVYCGATLSVPAAIRFSVRQALLGGLSAAGGVAAGPLLEALLLGVRDRLDADFIRLFQAAGCAHILALSGQHLGILSLFSGLIFCRLFGKRYAKVFNCLFVFLFVLIVNAGPSIIRAALMFWLASLAQRCDRPQPPLVYLSLTFLLHLLLDPAASGSLSFILSYSALAGLLVYAEGLGFMLRPYFATPIAGALAASLAAFLATAPILVNQSGSLQLAGCLTAVMAGPLTAALIWAGMISLCLVALVPGMAVLTVPVCTVLERCLMGCIRLGAGVPLLSLKAGWARILVMTGIALAGLVLYAASHGGYPFQTRLQFSQRPGGASR